MFRPRKEDFKFHRGDRVRAVDGSDIQGLVVGWYWDGHAQIMYTVNVATPAEKARWVGETQPVTIDECSLELVEAAKPEDQLYHEFEANYKYDIGDKVCNILAPSCEGRIRSIRCYTNLCFSYEVIKDEAKDNGKPKYFFIAENFVKPIEGDTNPLKPAATCAYQTNTTPTAQRAGGPTFAAPSQFDD